jgi:hypothetical protein
MDVLFTEQAQGWFLVILGVIAATTIAGALIVIVSAVGNKLEPKAPKDEWDEV